MCSYQSLITRLSAKVPFGDYLPKPFLSGLSAVGLFDVGSGDWSSLDNHLSAAQIMGRLTCNYTNHQRSPTVHTSGPRNLNLWAKILHKPRHPMYSTYTITVLNDILHHDLKRSCTICPLKICESQECTFYHQWSATFNRWLCRLRMWLCNPVCNCTQ